MFCNICRISHNDLNHNRSENHFKKKYSHCISKCTPVESAFANNINTFWLKNFRTRLLDNFLNEIASYFFEICNEQLISSSFKTNSILKIVFKKEVNPEITQEVSFKTKNSIVTRSSNLTNLWNDIVEKFKQEMSEFQEKGSGWVYKKVLGIEVRINKYNPLRASSYIPTPSKIKKTRAIINVKNNDIYCFKYAVLGKQLQSRHKNSIKHYKNLIKEKKYDFDCIEYPVSIDSIHLFEKKNGVTINVYEYQNDEILPIYCHPKDSDDIDLLILKNSNDMNHYCVLQISIIF